jgi:hypothetical protein
MPAQQQGFDGFPVLAGAQLLVCQAVLNVDGGVEISVRAVAADPTAKRLLVGPVGPVHVVAHAALLRGIGALDPDGSNSSFGGIPGDLPGDVPQVGGVQIGVHGPRLVLHGRHREVLVGELRARMFGEALVDRPVDLLAHVAGQALPTSACGRGQLLDPFLLQAFAELLLAPAFLAVALLPLSEFAVKGAVVLPVAAGQEVGNAHIYADHRGRWRSLYPDHPMVTEGQPPAIPAFVERHAAIEGLSGKRLAVIVGQLDRDQQLFAKFERADAEEGHVLLAERQVDLGELVERSQLPPLAASSRMWVTALVILCGS